MNANLGAQGPEQDGELLMLETPTGKIAGTLLMPKASGAVPLAVIIAGSGPTDRNGNSPLIPGANNSLKLLSEGLAAHGIASLRYDKRGIGASAAASLSEANLRFDNSAEDAAGWVDRLRQDPRFSTITIVGHSEGSLIGMLAAGKAKIDGFVSLCGSGEPIGATLRAQLKRGLPKDWPRTESRRCATTSAASARARPPW